MKFLLQGLILAWLLSSCSNTNKEGQANDSGSQVVAPADEDIRVIAGQPQPDTLKGSLKAKAMGSIANTGITINYYSPAVKGRVIWGGLVPFDNVWVTGAHRATTIEFDQEVEIGSTVVAPGKYGLFTIPGREEWTFIINKNWDQHLADDYDQKEDIVRVKAKPEAQETNQERLRYVVEPKTDSTGELAVYWEKIGIRLPIKVGS